MLYKQLGFDFFLSRIYFSIRKNPRRCLFRMLIIFLFNQHILFGKLAFQRIKKISVEHLNEFNKCSILQIMKKIITVVAKNK